MRAHTHLAPMFSTLKSIGDARGSLVLEPTRPPFDSKRQGKLARLACARCRAKKLKCSGDRAGCQRCAARSIPCSYPSPAPACPSASQRGLRSPSASVAGEGMQPDSHELFLPCLDAAADDFLNPATTAPWPFDDLFPGKDANPLATPPPTHCGQLDTLPFDSPSLSPSALAAHTQAPASQGSASRRDECDCDCMRQAIYAHEAAQVDLVSTRESTSTTLYSTASLIDVLQNQKAALASCQALVTCSRCSAQSAYVMFVISMCGTLLESIGCLHLLTSPCSGCAAAASPPEAPREAAHIHPGRRGVQIGRWRLDDDDERHVIQGLLSARMAVLGRLVARIEGVVGQNQWPAHASAIRSIQERCTRARFEMTE